MAGTADRVSRLSVERLRAAAERLKEKRRAAGGAPPAPLPRPAELPLSFAQERLWFLAQLEPGSGAYNMPLALALDGRLEPRILPAVLSAVADRHEVLRTRFVAVEGRPTQVIDSPAAVPLPVIDLAALPESAREETVRSLARGEARRPIDLVRGPLLRAALLRLGASRHVALFTLHHLIADGWSLGLLVREVAALYDAAGGGRPAALPALPLQYADFAVWQRQALAGEALAAQLAFWRGQLKGAPPALRLPADRPRPTVPGWRGESATLLLPPALWAPVAELGRRAGATPFMLLLAAFQLLLGRLSGEDDLVVGTPVAGRTRPEVEGLIGLFVNTLALRADLAGDPTFGALLDRVQQAALGAFAHQELPFSLLVAELRPERELGLTPLFQALFTLQNAPAETLELRGLSIAPAAPLEGIAEFDLALTVRESEGGLGGVLEGRADLFDPATVQRWAGHWTALLGELAGAGEQAGGRRLSELSLLRAGERHQLLGEWGLGPPAGGGPPRLHDLVAATAARAPAAVAIEEAATAAGREARRLTYADLLRAARRRAASLGRQGLRRRAPVAICLERSADLVIAFLAVLEAGGVAVPLDPSSPPGRLAGLVAEAGAAVVLTRQRFADALGPAAADGGPVRLLVGEDLAGEPAESPGEASAGAPDGPGPADLAYLIFTSGSTGRPKGVAVAHGPAAGHFISVTARLGVRPDDRVALISSPGFDTAIEEILPTLTAGATLVVCGAEAWPPGEIAVRAAGLGLTLLSLPTVVWQQWVEEMAAGRAPVPAGLPLRLVLVGGEAVPCAAARTWLACAPAARHGVRLLNGYGPTEAIVSATWREVDGRAAAGAGALPVGYPLPGRAAHVLGRGLLPVPAGVAGELCLGGEPLAVGYLGQGAATAERFVPDPFAGAPGARLYRTGDLVRRLPDGDLQFLGRTDRQLKIRGFRVEPGEVEAALAADPRVSECAVELRDDAPGGPGLVAYAVPRPGAAPTPAELRTALAARLASHLLPAAVLLLDALPLTPRGKLDRRALPSPHAAAPEAGPRRPPRDAVEHRLLQIWEETLGPGLGVDDDFFERGGHSLLAVRLMARIAAVFGRDLPLSALFQARTVEGLATLLRPEPGPAPAAGLAAGSHLVPLSAGGAGAPLFCIHPIGGGVFCYLGLARQLAPRPVLGLEARGLAEGEEPRRSVPEMAAAALEAVTAAQPAGPYRLAAWSFGALVALEMARGLTRRGDEVALLALIEPTPPGAGGDLPDETALLALLARDLAGLAGAAPGPAAAWGRNVHSVDPGERLEQLGRRAAAAGLLPADGGPGLVRRLAGVYRAHLAAARAYEPAPFAGPIDLWRAAASPPAAAQAWEPLAAGGLTVHTLPGDHYSLLREPAVRELGRALRARLAGLEG